MEEWKEYTLEELSIGKGSYGIGAAAVPYDSSLYTYLRITDINDDGSLNKSGLMSVNDSDADKYLLKPNDIVFARTGNSTGRSYFYDGSDGDLVYAGFLIKFSLNPKIVNPRILKYYTHSSIYYDWVRSFDTGGTRGNINAKTYGNMPIVLPPRSIQDKIVSILKSLDDKIENNRKINENLEQQAQALFKSWFVDFEPFRDQPFVESELGMIPEGWRVGTLGELSNISSGKRPPLRSAQITTTSNIPLLGAADLMGYTNSYLFDKPILVTGRVGTHGIIQRWSTPCWPSDNTLVIESDYYEYIFQILKRIDYKNLNRGSTQPLITQSDLRNQTILIPKELEILKFEEIVGTLMKKFKENNDETNRLSLLRDTLLPKLMSGKLKIS